MAEKINLRSSKVKERQRQVGTYGTQTPLSSTAVERGSTRWLNGSTVVIEGLLDVTGTASVSGALNVSGTTTLSGSTTIAGPTGITGALTIAGQLDVTGPTTLAGVLDITGDTTVTGDLNVDGPLDVTGPTTLGGTTEITGITTLRNELIVQEGKRITLGGLILENQGPGTAFVQMPGGGIAADNVLGMSLNHDRVQISAQTSATIEAPLINLNAPTVNIGSGADKISATSTYARIGSESHKFQAWNGIGISVKGLLSTALPPNLYADANGWLYKSTSTP